MVRCYRAQRGVAARVTQTAAYKLGDHRLGIIKSIIRPKIRYGDVLEGFLPRCSSLRGPTRLLTRSRLNYGNIDDWRISQPQSLNIGVKSRPATALLVCTHSDQSSAVMQGPGKLGVPFV